MGTACSCIFKILEECSAFLEPFSFRIACKGLSQSQKGKVWPLGLLSFLYPLLDDSKVVLWALEVIHLLPGTAAQVLAILCGVLSLGPRKNQPFPQGTGCSGAWGQQGWGDSRGAGQEDFGEAQGLKVCEAHCSPAIILSECFGGCFNPWDRSRLAAAGPQDSEHSYCGYHTRDDGAHTELRLGRELSPTRVLGVGTGRNQLPWANECAGCSGGGWGGVEMNSEGAGLWRVMWLHCQPLPTTAVQTVLHGTKSQGDSTSMWLPPPPVAGGSLMASLTPEMQVLFLWIC